MLFIVITYSLLLPYTLYVFQSSHLLRQQQPAAKAAWLALKIQHPFFLEKHSSKKPVCQASSVILLDKTGSKRLKTEAVQRQL